METFSLSTVRIIVIGTFVSILIAFGVWYYVDDERDTFNSDTAITANRHNINVIARINTLVYKLPDGDLKDSLMLTGKHYIGLVTRAERDSLIALDSLSTDSVYSDHFINSNFRIISDTVAIDCVRIKNTTVTLWDTLIQTDTVVINPIPEVQKINDSTYTISCKIC